MNSEKRQQPPDAGGAEALTLIRSHTGTAWRWLKSWCNKASLTYIWIVCGSIFFLCLILIAFNESDSAAINAVLDARNQAISSRDINAYSQLIADDYKENGHGKQDMLAQTVDMFRVFIELHMQSFDREVRLLNKQKAECRQSYRLKARAGADWRQIVEREQIKLKKTDEGWQISGGL